ncbi:MAG: hypothetical protein ACKV2O_09140 [Acidimicrobiales bacterium]
MLSSIHPLGEAGRNQRWWLTVAAHIAGSVLGAATVAAALGGLGWVAATAGLGWPARLVLIAVVAAVAVAVDARGWPSWLWRPHRQVNEDWLTRYRGWVYGGGFGLQLGMGITTIVTAATLYLLGMVTFALANPLAAGAVGAVFGLVRGASVLAGRSITAPERLVAFHRGLQQRARWGKAAAVLADSSILVGTVGLLVAGR